MDKRFRRGKESPSWKGGRLENDPRGYVEVYAPCHPRAHDVHVREHILLAEKALGKPLPPKATIHHHNLEDLVICQDQAYHMLLHRRTRAYYSSGHAGWEKCRYCQKWDEPQNMKQCRREFHHKNCRNDFLRNQRLAKKGLSPVQASWRKCWICKQYDDPKNPDFIIRKTSGAYHRECLKKYRQQEEPQK
jgi:hypothetical protein